MEYENLKLDLRGRILWIAVNRPKKLNALNVATVGEIDTAIREAADDPAVWAICVTGSGDKSFVAGADIEELNTLGAVEAKEFAERGQAVFGRIEKMRKPVIAAVNGFALGGGCELAMACHFRIAVTTAVFGQPEVKLGLIPGYGGTQRLPRLVGRGRALELLLSGRNVPAEEAERIGLVNRVCDPDELEATVEEFLKPILRNGPLAVAQCIEAVNRGLGLELDQACAVEAALFGVGAASPEMTEGTAAFLEKRRANFRREG
jgi:enoyl-CoA hydratase